MSWTGVSRFYACNWMGAVRSPTTKLYKDAFIGALDEVKLLDYVRPEGGYLSEAERGRERLAKAGRDGVVPVEGAVCSTDGQCRTTELCNAGRCERVSCDPTVQTSCARGRCQRLPVELAATEQYACVAECTTDNSCLEKECANGPCRICNQTTHTCNECQSVVENVGGLRLEYIQGCPDRNSFACDRGACVSECYSFENGQTKYLCDPATEYCRAGRCALFDWNWADVAPVSMAGAGELSSGGVEPTIAVSQLYPVEIQALGVRDNTLPPELLVEAQAPGVFGGDWFDIGRIKVANETRAEAQANPYTVYTPYPITRLRLRTIVPAYENLMNGAMGLTHGRTQEFCDRMSDNRCRFMPPSSRATLGYEGWIPGHLWKCMKKPEDCATEHLPYLQPGVPVALVLKVKVKGQDQLPSAGNWTNKICPYWDGTRAAPDPVDPTTGRSRLMIYGDASREVSFQKTAYYPTAAATSLAPFDSRTRGFAVLNCNYVDDTGSAAQIAGLELPVTGVTYPEASAAQDGPVQETANGCTVNLGTPTQARYEACFEWQGADVSFDPFASEPEPYRTLTVGRFRSFGWGTREGDKTP
jgi:hypothetical protein